MNTESVKCLSINTKHNKVRITQVNEQLT